MRCLPLPAHRRLARQQLAGMLDVQATTQGAAREPALAHHRTTQYLRHQPTQR
jgi:hypothetical protein